MKIFKKLWEFIWYWIYEHRPEKYRDIKYVGYTMWWLNEATEDIEDMDFSKEDKRYYYERGKLSAYKDLLDELRRE
jgi:hypothetical protein